MDQEINDECVRLLRHTLGLNRSHEAYRNHFVASDGHSDMPNLLFLEQHGLMARAKTPGFLDPDTIVFVATEAGKALAHSEAVR